MPLGTRIWLFTKSIVELERNDYGAYELLDNSDNVLYIGYGNIRNSLMKHFADGQDPIEEALNFSAEYTLDKEKAKKRQQEELGKYYQINKKYPKFNTR